MVKAFRIFLKFLKYTFFICLILIALAAAGTYFFQDKIIEITFKEINKNLDTRIEIDKKVNLSIFEKFPQISISLSNVRVYENVPQSNDKLATFQNLYFTFNAFDFLQGKYVINTIYAEAGDVKIKIDKNGFANYFIFKSDTTSDNNVSFNLEKIILEDVMVDYSNLAIDQNHQIFVKDAISKVSVMEKVWFIGLNGNLLVNRIGIGGNEYFKEKEIKINSEQEYYEETRLFKVRPSTLFVEGSEFKLAGFYGGKEKNEIDFNLKAEKSTIATLISLLPKKINHELGIYESSGNIFFEASVKGFISAHEDPKFTVDFGFRNASFFHPHFNKKIENATLRGSFSNGEYKRLSSCSMKLKNISAVFDGKTFTGNFEIENFNDPFLKFNMIGILDVESLLKFYPIEKVLGASGSLNVDIAFEGRPEDLKTNEGKEKVTALGEIIINDLNVSLKNSPEYKNINGHFTFNKNDVVVKELSGVLGNSDFKIEGIFRNIITKMIFDKEKLIVEANIHSNHIDLEEILHLFEAGPAAKPDANNPYPHLADYKFKLLCDLKSLEFKRFHARNLKTLLDFSQPIGMIKNASMDIAGGKIKLNSIINFHSKERIELNTKASISKINIDSVFYICENFNQDYLVDKNLKGEFSGDIRTFFAMNHDLDINSSSLIATIDASIVNGELNNFEPIKALSELKLVEEDQLRSIKFSELKNKIFIENRKIQIPEMEIKSSVSNVKILITRPTITNIKISGTHTFDQEIDYKITLALKKFKGKADKDEAFGAIEEDNLGNALIFLTIKGTTDNYKVEYDRQRTGKKIKEGLKNERKELEEIFKTKKPAEVENSSDPNEEEFFDF